MNDIKIQYSISINNQQVSFLSLDEIKEDEYYGALINQIYVFDKKIKIEASRHLISKELGLEKGKQVSIEIKSDKMKESYPVKE